MKNRCTKTLSGKHLFIDMEWVEDYLAKAFEKYKVRNPQKCVVCGMINDKNQSEE